MTNTTLNTVYTVLSNIDFENKDAVLAEVYKDLHRNDDRKAEKAAAYDAARDIVLETIRTATAPVTVAEIFAACEDSLPGNFSKNQVQYGLGHYWADAVNKIEGKVNAYTIKA